MKCVIPMSCSFWTWQVFLSILQSGRKKILLLLAAAPARTIRSRWRSFFDLFYIGEGEVVYDSLLDLYKEMKHAGASRQDYLRKAASVPGIYVPSLYRAEYREDGTLANFFPLYPDVPEKVEKQLVLDLDSAPYPKAPVVPYVKAAQDRVVLEIQRAASAAAGSARPGWCIGLFGKKRWIL